MLPFACVPQVHIQTLETNSFLIELTLPLPFFSSLEGAAISLAVTWHHTWYSFHEDSCRFLSSQNLLMLWKSQIDLDVYLHAKTL
jgi:hypothetical protein